MEIDKNRFYSIPAGVCSIGLCDDDIEQLIKKFSKELIKKQYLLNSFPKHSISTKSFYISKKAVSVQQYRDFVYHTGYKTEAEIEGWAWTWEKRWIKSEGLTWRTPFGNDADRLYYRHKDILPVLQVSWNDAVAYCRWLSRNTGTAVMLPHEYQWEYFRSIIKKDACIGKSYDIINSMLDYIQAIRDICVLHETVTPAGLVWEWTEDWFQSYPHGIVNREFGEVYKVLRGGSLMSTDVQKIRQYRFRRCPTARSPFYGFRILVY